MPLAPDRAWVEALRSTLPEPPDAHRRRLQSDWSFTDLEMRDVVAAGAVGLVEATVAAGASPAGARKWWMGELIRRAGADGSELDALPVTPEQVARVQAMVEDGTLNDQLARQVLEGVLAGEGGPDEVVAARGLGMVSDDSALLSHVDAAISAHPDVAAKVRGGKVAASGALVGAVMKAPRGSADAARVRELVLARLGAAG